jgi:hypothetical protein
MKLDLVQVHHHQAQAVLLVAEAADFIEAVAAQAVELKVVASIAYQ